MLNMLARLAEYERELITERVSAGIAAARQTGTRFGRPVLDPVVVAEKLELVTEARKKGRTAKDAARLVGWSRATLYRHQQAHAAAGTATPPGASEAAGGRRQHERGTGVSTGCGLATTAPTIRLRVARRAHQRSAGPDRGPVCTPRRRGVV
jgi:transposase-like protein